MRPTRPTTDAERRVLRWLLLVASVVVVVYLGWHWWLNARACTAYCVAQKSSSGTLRLAGNGRFNLGTVCECAGKKTAAVSATGE